MSSTEIRTFDDAELDAALADLDMPGEVVATAAVETIEVEGEVIEVEASAEAGIVIDDAAIEDVVAEIELRDEVAEIHAAAEGSDVATDEEIAAEPAAETPRKLAPAAEKAPKKAATPRVSVDDLAPEAFVLTVDMVDCDLAANKAAVLAKRPAQKKVAEKFDNLLVSVATGKAPSKFTMDCFRALNAKGELTSADMVAALQAGAKKSAEGGYSIGTARSQSGQMMSLFPALKIATRDGNKIVLNPDSTIAEALRSIAA